MDFDFYPDLNKKPQAPEAPAAPVQTGSPAGQYASHTQYSDPNDFFFGEQLRRNADSAANEKDGPREFEPVMMGALVGGVVFGCAILSAAFTSIIYSTGAIRFFSAFLILLQVAAAAVAGILAYKNLKGSAIFLGSLFVSGSVASIVTQFMIVLFAGYTMNNLMNIASIFVMAGMMPVCIMGYEKIKDSDKLPKFNFAESLGLSAGEGNSLYNPIFITAAVGAVALVARLINGIWNHCLISADLYGSDYLRGSAIMMVVINVLALILVVGAGLFLSGSIKKTVEFLGYFCIANKVSVALVNLFNVDHLGSIVLTILLSIVFVAIGTAASFAFTYLSEKDTKINIKIPKR